MQTQTERLGVSKLDHYFSSHGWLFREQMVHDYGIDAHVETTNENYPTGQLIAIQIKSGMSFFSEENENSYIFRTEDKHIEYWSNHTLPVILVLYNTDDDILYWQDVNEDTVISTGKGWKIEVPKTHVLDDRSLIAFSKLTQPEPYIQKLNKLKLDRYWMEKITKGYEVFVEFDDWINKSLSRYQIRLSCEDESQHWPMTYCPGMSIEEALEFFLPWADFRMDIEAHREGSIGQWDAECYMTYDKEEGRAIHGMSFDEWYNEPEGIVPYQEDGEIASYRIQLELNELGRSFMEIDGFLSEKSKFQGKTFTTDDLQW
ncbi:DUF4365 domain-containing protein [Shewanella loihica]|uniref:DUF4365 domain-containing protein n=1 Tax=Shewanella loihica (strain ATCC BAA-1088 / PV-4) TaxID=323850 RepID=A3QDL2_SHELP|nr:DUF4365 domain-containing protein [Shewanella loihica]ABO23560.1 conserved hypothetical protein [Shewanella loihica PV-4]